jgi:hypothetical protein
MNALSRIAWPESEIVADGRAKLVQLSQSLANPVARGLLPSAIADAAILTAALRAERSGQLKVDPIDLAEVLQHIMRIVAEQISAPRSVATWRIQRTTAAMFDISAPLNRLLAEAHNSNGDTGFPLREWEVTEVVGIQLAAAMRGEEDAHAK